MSVQEKARMIRAANGKEISSREFAERVADALKRAFGHGNGAVKRAATVAETNTRTARNWFDASNAPRGDHLIALIRECDEVLAEVLEMAGRADALDGAKKAATLAKIQEAIKAVEGA